MTALHPALPFGDDPTRYDRVFKSLYYHLYSNGDASRAESIFRDTAKLLLLRALSGSGKGVDVIERFTTRSADSGDLITLLKQYLPRHVDSDSRFALGDDALRKALAILADVDLSGNVSSVIGDAFQALIGPRMRGDKGQFFTPRSLVNAMVRIADPGPAMKIVDPAAGTGGFLFASAAYVRDKPRDSGHCEPIYVGMEKDSDIQMLGAAMLEIATEGSATIHLANSLDIAALGDLRPNPLDADIVLTNPPFGSKIGVPERSILKQFELGHEWSFDKIAGRWRQLPVLRASQDPQILFLELCLRLLKPGGLCGIVLPEGVFGNRQSGYVWDFVRSKAGIAAILDCPRTTFQPCTDTKTNVLFVRRLLDTHEEPQSSPLLVAVSKHCGHDRRGRTVALGGKPVRDDFSEIAKDYLSDRKEHWRSVSCPDPYYLVPRYYHDEAATKVECLARQLGTETVLLGDLIKQKVLRMRKGDEVGSEAYGSGDIPFVRTSDIHNFEISIDPTNGVSEEVYERYRRPQGVRALDILLVVDGRYKVGRSAIVHSGQEKCVIQSHIRIMSVADRCPFSAFDLLYTLSLPEVLEQMRNMVFIQSTLGSIGSRLDGLILPLPSSSDAWVSKVAEFRALLERRAQALITLKQTYGQEVEL